MEFTMLLAILWKDSSNAEQCTIMNFYSMYDFSRWMLGIVLCGACALGCSNHSGNDSIRLENGCELFEKRVASKVINGDSCADRITPVARLDLFDDEENRSTCTAVMVSSEAALTAAHCNSDLVYRAELSINDQTLPVRSITSHPQYTGRPMDGRLRNDVAVIRFNGEYRGPLAKVSARASDPERPYFYVFGFGTDRVGPSRPGVRHPLRSATVDLYAMSDLFLFDRFESSLEQNVCFGDSGGPAFAQRDDELFLVGLTSTGSNDSCAVGDVSAFTRLSAPEIRAFLAEQLPQVNLGLN